MLCRPIRSGSKLRDSPELCRQGLIRHGALRVRLPTRSIDIKTQPKGVTRLQRRVGIGVLFVCMAISVDRRSRGYSGNVPTRVQPSDPGRFGWAGYHIGARPGTAAWQPRRGEYDLSGLRASGHTEDIEVFDCILAMDRDNLTYLNGLSSPGDRKAAIVLDCDQHPSARGARPLLRSNEDSDWSSTSPRMPASVC